MSWRRREPAKISESPEELSKSFFKVPFLEIFFRHVLGSFRDVKTYSEQKRFMGQDFYKHPPNLLSLFQDNFSSQSKSHSADSVFSVIFDEKVKKKAFFGVGRRSIHIHVRFSLRKYIYF